MVYCSVVFISHSRMQFSIVLDWIGCIHPWDRSCYSPACPHPWLSGDLERQDVRRRRTRRTTVRSSKAAGPQRPAASPESRPAPTRGLCGPTTGVRRFTFPYRGHSRYISERTAASARPAPPRVSACVEGTRSVSCRRMGLHLGPDVCQITCFRAASQPARSLRGSY